MRQVDRLRDRSLLGILSKKTTLIVGPPHSSGGSWFVRAPRRSRSGGTPMFAIGIGFLVLFSAISVMLGNEDPRHDTDPRNARDTLALWARFSAR